MPIHPDIAPSWKNWVKKFLHGRTHDAYGLILVIVTNALILLFSQSIFYRVLSLLGLIGGLGVFIDLTAHEWYG